MSHFDIVVVGGGMVGTALAVALSGRGLGIGLIEIDAPAADLPEAFDLRVSALNLRTRQFLDTLGAWSGIVAERHCPFQGMSVWDGDGTGHIEFSAADVGSDALGHIVENTLVQQALWAQAQARADITCFCPERLESLSRAGETFTLHLASGQALTAGLVVGADGALSRVRSLLGFELEERDYGHHALVTTVRCEREHGYVARQNFLPDGPLAFLPLRTRDGDLHHCSIVWSAAPDRVTTLMKRTDEAFLIALANAVEQRLGKLEWVDRRQTFPLRERRVRHPARDGAVLIGDAAHTIHPLAGQGVNLGFNDAIVLAEEIDRALARKLPLWHDEVLRRYERRRGEQTAMMMATMRGFQQLFAADLLPVRYLRNAGMNLLNRMPPVKQQIMRLASGV